MNKIRRLDEGLINKIAAGEVIERPASVVKELVDNALDSGARTIRIEVRDGGRSYLAISDDGSGMDAADLLLAIERHATSKIERFDDLLSVRTMGFRGEALSSIAAVSTLTMRSVSRRDASARVAGCDIGAEVVVRAGILETAEPRPFQGPAGTTVCVEDLFATVPARLKFMKSAASEWAAILELVQAYALSVPHVEWRLLHDGKEKFSAPARADAGSAERGGAMRSWGEPLLRRRGLDVLGSDVVEGLLYTREESRWCQVEALASPPGLERGSSKWIYTFVNGRWIQDRALRSAIFRGYASHLLRGRYPVVIAMISVDPTLLDVNVHPAKTEVRFQYERETQQVVVQALQKVLRQGAWAAPPMPVLPRLGGDASASYHNQPTSLHLPAAGGMSLPEANVQPPRPAQFQPPPLGELGVSQAVRRSEVTPPLAPPPPLSPASGLDAIARMSWESMRFLETVARCYLLFETEQGQLLVVDQHAFHERIIFERLRRNPRSLGATESLLVPEWMELGAGLSDPLRREARMLRGLGIDLEFDDDRPDLVGLKGVPGSLKARDMRVFLERCAEGLRGCAAEGERVVDDVLATLACHSAVRAGELLTRDEVERLVREASDVDFYHNCPHGRRVLRFWTEGDMARWFDRPA